MTNKVSGLIKGLFANHSEMPQHLADLYSQPVQTIAERNLPNHPHVMTYLWYTFTLRMIAHDHL